MNMVEYRWNNLYRIHYSPNRNDPKPYIHFSTRILSFLSHCTRRAHVADCMDIKWNWFSMKNNISIRFDMPYINSWGCWFKQWILFIGGIRTIYLQLNFVLLFIVTSIHCMYWFPKPGKKINFFNVLNFFRLKNPIELDLTWIFKIH